jgi:hypothetical protein
MAKARCEMSRRVRSDSCRCAHRFSQVQETVHYIEQPFVRHRTRTFQEEHFAFRKKHGAHFDEKYFLGSRSYRTLRDKKSPQILPNFAPFSPRLQPWNHQNKRLTLKP